MIWFKSKKKLHKPLILSAEMCADHGLAQVCWSVALGVLQPEISFDSEAGPFLTAGNAVEAKLDSPTPVGFFYMFPNTTTAWIRVTGSKLDKSVMSNVIAVYVGQC